MAGAAAPAEASALELVRLLVLRVASWQWLRKLAVYAALALVALRLSRRRKSLKGKLVLITGAATGIGREQAFEFARQGARLAVWDINEEQLDKTCVDVREQTGAEIKGYKCNLANKDEIYATAGKVKEAQGEVYCLVNNAGIISGQALMDTPDSRIELSMKVNAMAYFWTAKAFLPDMLAKNEGHIVGISSAAGIFPNPRMIDYCTSKFAARGFMEALHTELHALGKTGIKTTVVCPAHINTDLFKGAKMTGGVMSPAYVAKQVVDAVQYNRFHVYLPAALQAGIFWQTVMPSSIWDFFMSFSYSSMNEWKPDQANKIFSKIGDK